MIPTPPYSVAACGEVRGTGENKRNSQTRQTNRKIIGLFNVNKETVSQFPNYSDDLPKFDWIIQSEFRILS